MLVRKGGLEPPHLTALEPKSSASTNSATLAVWRTLYGDAGGGDFRRATMVLPCNLPKLRGVNSVSHYENFPVASVLVPARIRADVIALYHFARGADDIADEGDATPVERLSQLEGWSRAVAHLAGDESAPKVQNTQKVANLKTTVEKHHLDTQLLHALLSAFKQDVVKTRYADFAELEDYCRRSANPVGRLMLQLMQVSGDGATAASDAICTSLQLINFLQDVEIDWRKARVYLPQSDLARFGVSETDLAAQRTHEAWQALMAFQCARARERMLSGRPLLSMLSGRMRLEIALTMAGGLTILDKIEHVHYDVFTRRPRLSAATFPRLLHHTVRLLR